MSLFGGSYKKVEARDIPYEIICYTGEVKHFFTHELIYDPQKAFSRNNNLRYCLDRDHLTTSEFLNFLEEMRTNNYILIDFETMYEIKDGKLNKKELFLPVNKKPFTLSLDDMSYDTTNLGIITKLIIDEDGEIKDYTESENKKVTSERESITILEEYLKKYPKFSYNNSKMCICVNGYNGILGYRIQENTEKAEKEREELKKVVQKLKQLGYTFASHSYTHSFINSVTPEFLVRDMKRWEKEIQSIVGDTKIFCFPGGIHDHTSYNDYLIRERYNLLLCVGLDLNKKGENGKTFKYIYRTPLDGNSLRTYPNMYRDIFEPSKIYDNTSRIIKYRNV